MDDTEATISLFNDSFDRVSNTDFFDIFYTLFLNSSKEVANKFAGTDMRRQKQMLKQSIAYMLSFYTSRIPSKRLKALANIHSKKYIDIRPELYQLWLNSLVEAVKRCDRNFCSQTEEAWRSVMKPGIDFMIKNYKN